MAPNDLGEVLVCRRARTLVKVGPNGERDVHPVARCPLEACTAGYHEGTPPEPTDGDALLARRFGVRVCGELVSPLVTALDAEVSAAEALAVLDAANLSSAPVVDDNQVLAGLVSARELRAAAAKRHVAVEDVMTTTVVSVSSRASVDEITRVMAEHDLDRVPVVDGDGRLVAVVTAIDVLRWVRRYAMPERAAHAPG